MLLSLARLFPDAPIYTLLHVKGSLCDELEAREIRTTFVQRLPGVATRYREYLPLFPAAAATIDLAGFDLVITSSHCVAKGVRAAPGALHVCYCHTPMRYVWDRYDDYFGRGRARGAARFAMPLVAGRLRAWDVATAPRVHRFIANSRHVAGRIRRYYGRDSTVIPPPVDTDFFTPAASPGAGSYDLVISALAPYKRIDLVIEAYRGTGRPLKIVGAGPEETRLRERLPREASLLGRVDDETLRDLYRGCRAVVMAGVEDFGIVPLEAMACGRPVIALRRGGAAEVVAAGTGVLFDEATEGSLERAVDEFESRRFNPAEVRRHALGFDRQVYREAMEALLHEAVEAFQRREADPPGLDRLAGACAEQDTVV